MEFLFKVGACFCSKEKAGRKLRKEQFMRIASSEVTMYSGRNFTQMGMRGQTDVRSSFAAVAKMMSSKNKTRDTFEPGSQKMSGYNVDDINYFKGVAKAGESSRGIQGAAPTTVQNSLLASLFHRFSSFGVFSGGGMNQQSMVTYEEKEETGFHACGRAITEDGRTIDFGVDVFMSRSYMEYMNIQTPVMSNSLFDPLVINVGSDTADVRDQTFKFDIDADGKLDEISMLGRGSGFLALDKNGNGKIDDGNELFGTKTGDGFGDLRQYDSDGNGWIDENDEVFSKLKVWCKGADGEDIMMDLKACDIGAIYLGEQQTEFTMGGADGIRDAVVRSTGVFLRESGSAGTIQHVDMAMKDEKVSEAVSGDALTEVISADGHTQALDSSQSNQTKRNEKTQKVNERAAKRRAERKAMEKKQMEKRMEKKRKEAELLQQRFEERREYHEKLMDERLATSLFYSI